MIFRRLSQRKYFRTEEDMHKELHKILGGLLTAVMLLGGIHYTAVPVQAASENLIQNPDFTAEGDLSVWSAAQGGAVITAENAKEAIYDSVTSYGKITGRSSNYECFAQDVTAVVENNKVYDYSFYVMLDKEDYADASPEMRTVEISPFITVGGSTTYSQGVSGTVSQVLEPGVWTKFSGTYSPSWSGELEQAVIRILEQGTDYGQGDGIMGTYYVTGVKIMPQGEKELLIDTEAVNLCDAVREQTKEDFLVGTSICNSDLADANEMALVTKHFNALTLGNELKPDAMFGYSNNKCPGTETVTLNGEELEVPKMDYSRAEKTLNYIYDWNQENPDKIIKIRGHVLVWHSQTPEWWFHEDYDASKPYADTDTMNKRLEWYIKTMAEHFAGKDSKYRGMFYGWDVVNEAVSDGTGTYRNASEKSSWWAVYGSNEFIINAFRYANKYMPAEIELYYNDYNEFGEKKRGGIVQLLTDVKEAEGTRIDGMGMQGHYQTTGTPTMGEFAQSARAFAEVVGKVQVTELDMASSSFYDGTDATRASEFSTQAYRYKELFNTIKELRAEGVNFTGITLWGVVDKYSWLQTSSSVGGGTDGTRKQCPLLFDDNYQIKPAFWAFADDSKLTPAAKQFMIAKSAEDGGMRGAQEVSFSAGDMSVTFKPIWGDNYLTVKVTVNDKEANDGDYFVVYASADGKEIQKKEIKRADAMEVILKGYEYSVKFDMDESYMKEGGEIYFDLVVYNDNEAIAYSDMTLSQDSSTDYYAKATLIANPEAAEETKKDKDDKDSQKETKEADTEDTSAGAEESNAQEVVSEHVAEKSNTWIYVVIGVVVAVCAAVGVALAVKKKKK